MVGIAAALERELGRLEGRLKLTEQAESSMRTEQERLLDDLQREGGRVERLEEELGRERQRGFWSRLFGG